MHAPLTAHMTQRGIAGSRRFRVADIVLVSLLAFFAAIVVRDAVRVTQAGEWGFDFKGSIWQPAHDITAGVNPYPEPTESSLYVGNAPLHPPLAFVFGLPLTAFDADVASAIWLVVLLAAAAASLWLLRVRDWRCYAAVAVSQPLFEGVSVGNLTILLMLPAALAWRYRARVIVVGVATGLAMALKLFLWPLLIWLLVTRRFKAAVLAFGVAVGLIVASWSVIGFDGARDYPKLLSSASRVLAERSTSVVATIGVFGGSRTLGQLVGILAGAAVLGVVALRVKHERDRTMFAAALCSSLLFAPVVWTHYFALLFLAIAVVRPTFDWIWLVPVSLRLLRRIAEELPPAPYRACCPPEGTESPSSWLAFHSELPAWWLVGSTAALMIIVLYVIRQSGKWARPQVDA